MSLLEDGWTIHVTQHAYDRFNERFRYKKRTVDRMAKVAYLKGVKHADTNGRLNAYITKRNQAYMTSGTDIRIYGEVVYIFVKHPSVQTVNLVTGVHLDNDLKNQMRGVIRKRKEGRKEGSKEIETV